MQALGNQFVILDTGRSGIRSDIQKIQSLASIMLDLGFDQIITIFNSSEANVYMSIANRDGSEAFACGNGACCVAWLLMKETGRTHVSIQTRTGILQASHSDLNYRTSHDAGDLITIDMGEPRLLWHEIPLSKDTNTIAVPIQTVGLPGSALLNVKDPNAIEPPSVWPLSATMANMGTTSAAGLPNASMVNMGNPHAVFFVTNLESYDLKAMGPELERHPIFPERANISIAEVIDAETVKVKVWERGVGLTQACGTAACAVLVSGVRLGKIDRKIRVIMPGGSLFVEWKQGDNHVMMSSSVTFEFAGLLNPDTLSWKPGCL